ncbi:MAG: sensor histidine kinase [Kineosporiaceae bacterium]|nr:sensor histidine kinase [Kineosporiaceae bacterium]
MADSVRSARASSAPGPTASQLSSTASQPGRLARFFALDDDWVRPAVLGRSDVVVGLVTLLFCGATLELYRSSGGLEETDAAVWLQWLAVTAGALILIGRRRWPLTVASLAAAHLFVVGVSMPPVMGLITSQVVYFMALFSGVAWARSRREMALVIGALITFMFAWLAWQFALGSSLDDARREMGADAGRSFGLVSPIAAIVLITALINVLYFGGAVLAGQITWRGARQQARLAEQAELLAVQGAELRRRAVVSERLRIARELHDVVAHHVSVIGVQAGAARRVLERDPSRLDDARAALGEIETSSREAVGQMRGLLGALRTGADGALEQEQAPRSDQPRDPALSPVETDSRTSSPGVEELAELVTASASASLTTTYTLVESPSAAVEHLPTAVSRSLYRVAQESLANVRRHSTATKVTVVLRVDQVATGGYAELEVTDDGRPRSGTSGSGLGQLGIRERVAMHRGEADIGPRVAGGYRVRVRLPLTAAAS